MRAKKIKCPVCGCYTHRQVAGETGIFYRHTHSVLGPGMFHACFVPFRKVEAKGVV